MKVTKTIEVNICDVCKEKEAYSPPCSGCGKDFCYDCRKTHAVEYPCGVYHTGSGDRLYCIPCDAEAKHNPLHIAYAALKSLRNENEEYSKSFEMRRKNVEAELKRLLKEVYPTNPAAGIEYTGPPLTY